MRNQKVSPNYLPTKEKRTITDKLICKENLLIILLCLIVLITLLGCPDFHNDNVQWATLELILREDSTSFFFPTWAPFGNIVYIMCSKDTTLSGLWMLNPETNTKRLIKQNIGGPIATSADGKIAGLSFNTLIVFDTLGNTIWHKYIPGRWIIWLAFSRNNDGIYLSKTIDGQQRVPLLFISMTDSTQVDTILNDIQLGNFRITKNDSAVIYINETVEGGEPYHLFYKYKFASRIQSFILRENYTEGFDVNPVSPEWIAIGKRGNGLYEFIGRRILLHNMNNRENRLFEAYPYKKSYIYVCSWSPDGSKILLDVTPYVGGDPIRPLPSELWIAKDLF